MMKLNLFSRLHNWILTKARHRHAERYLSVLSVAESSFFPIPPDVLLVPMTLAQPSNAFRYALLTTMSSVFGGILGYLLGYCGLQFIITPLIAFYDLAATYQQLLIWFQQWGVWLVFIAGFSPIPYKIFTVASGVLALPLLPFIFASLLGRGLRFFAVAYLVRWGQARFKAMQETHIEWLGWLLIFLTLFFFGAKIVYSGS